MKKTEYGLPTAVAMIVGIVIGSGIFFKSDNILVATEGSISLGVLVFCIAAIGIIFGSLSISELASRTSEAGGIITYGEYCYNKPVACSLGWFHTFLYFPTLVSVISWVAGIYTCILFNIKATLEIQLFIGIIIMLLLYTANILSARLGGYFQNASTIIKLIPLILIAIAGVIFGDVSTISITDITQMKSTGWIAAIAPIAFSFDGWIVATSIGHEIKDPKKNLPKALVMAPLFILAIYVLYFIGISTYVGPEQVMALGDEHVYVAATSIFGAFGAKLILIFVIISIMGTINGLILGMTRMPYSLAIRNMFPKAEKVSKVNEKLGMPVLSSLIALALCLLWTVGHYVTQKFGLLPNSDISEISITVNYVLYILLYAKVFKMGVKGEIKGLFRGKINPILATIGSLIILIGSLSNPLFFIYAAICGVVLIAGVLFCKKNQNKIKELI